LGGGGGGGGELKKKKVNFNPALKKKKHLNPKKNFRAQNTPQPKPFFSLIFFFV